MLSLVRWARAVLLSGLLSLVSASRRCAAHPRRQFLSDQFLSERSRARINGIGGAAVVAVPDPDRGERLFGLYMADAAMGPELVWQGLADSGLPKLWIPKARDLKRIDELPTLGSGKIDMRRLKAAALSLAAAG